MYGVLVRNVRDDSFFMSMHSGSVSTFFWMNSNIPTWWRVDVKK